MYLLSGHKVKKNTLYFEVRHIFLLQTDINTGRLCGGLSDIRIVVISTALKISLFLQTRDYTERLYRIAYYSYASVTWVYLKIAKH